MMPRVRRAPWAAALGLALGLAGPAGAAPDPGAFAPPGPAGVATLPPEGITPWTAYAAGSRSRLAILLTDPDSRWLPLVHGLKAMGVPFVLVRDPAEALRHRVVMVYADLLHPDPGPFERFLKQGGTLITMGEVPKALAASFGVGPSLYAERMGLDFNDLGKGLAGLEQPRECHLRMGLPGGNALKAVGWKTLADGTQALAAYEDGSAAIVRRRCGEGMAYAFGMNFGTILYRGQSGRDEWFARDYVNAFEPAGDVFLRLFRAIYLQGEPSAVLLGTVPKGRQFTFLVTHDIDFVHSLHNSLEFAKYRAFPGDPGHLLHADQDGPGLPGHQFLQPLHPGPGQGPGLPGTRSGEPFGIPFAAVRQVPDG